MKYAILQAVFDMLMVYFGLTFQISHDKLRFKIKVYQFDLTNMLNCLSKAFIMELHHVKGQIRI